MTDDFAVFILTHGRADNVVTYETIKRLGYTGKIYLLIDNEDNQAEQYYKLYGDQVIMFDKKEQAGKCDIGDLSDNRKVILFARNHCFEEAKKLGLKSFLELDDDYVDFQRRYIENGKLMCESIYNLDKAFEAMLDFLFSTNSLTVAFCQGGDFIGGSKCKRLKEGLLRKAMNTFFCRADKEFRFVGRINEDVNTYTTLGIKGEKIFSPVKVMIVQKQTQKNKGGMTETYLDTGTYLKSFFSVMYAPSCVRLQMLGSNHKRIHHKVLWENCCPKIISEKYRKGEVSGQEKQV